MIPREFLAPDLFANAFALGVLAVAFWRRDVARWRRVVYLLPRVFGCALAAFLVVLSLDAFAEGRTLVDNLRAFAMHLIPAALVLAAVAIAWRWEWAGGVIFFALAVAYGVFASGRVSWLLAISLPLVIEGVLFLWSSRLHHGQERRAGRPPAAAH